MTPDWPGDTTPLPRHVADERLAWKLAVAWVKCGVDGCGCGEDEG